MSPVARQLETHYDNLKVLRNAPVEVIKASYRALSQKYHPDRNPDPDALHAMQTINLAWDVLSDPERRATHDRWIASHEGNSSPPARGTLAGPRFRYAPQIAGALGVVLVMAFIAAQFINAHSTDSDAMAAAPVASQSAPQIAPGGYISSEVQYFASGLSSIEIDNSGATLDAEVRLERSGRMARSMEVQHGKVFLVGQLPPGTYTMKYKVVDHGKVRVYQVNDAFQVAQSVEETDEGRHDKFSELRVTIANVAGGTHEIAPEDF